MATLRELLADNRISIYDHDVYVLFEGNDLGRDFLRKKIESIAMERAMRPDPLEIMQQDGRRLEWQEIRSIIQDVNNLMENT